MKNETMAMLKKEKEARKSKVNEIRAKFNFLRDRILEQINAHSENTGVIYS